ncbi:HAMP domain-containing histidine kinase [Hymenobacter sp. DH14]|uniref:histidine kinase n=1 Tax=Hymenobacter cyanobacteriorum TaxID=2926463 RepID=A0A9X2AIG7_9BACT|nr:HAMP domain-containing sensor histidine kinase [Hymenobacter cyanobacteriorum]MCI1189953.1 HAMP domain-containing histidine kinase [Hymenobacter cyanobacteriorum]
MPYFYALRRILQPGCPFGCRPAPWLLGLLLAWACLGSPARAARPYWDVSYDSLAVTLPRQPTDEARLQTLQHLLDLRPTGAQALPLLDRLLALNQQLGAFEAQPYRSLRAGVALWQQGKADAAALDSMHRAIAGFDRVGRPIPWILIDLAGLYNRLNRMEDRRRYYETRLAYYRVRGAVQNEAACYMSQGGYYRRMGDYNRTLNSILRAADLLKGYDQRLYVRELLVAGDVYAQWGNYARAAQYLNMAQRLPDFRRIDGMAREYTFLTLSRGYARNGELATAQHLADSVLAARVPDPLDQQLSRAYGMVQKSLLYLQQQQPAAAAALLARAQRLDDSLHVPMTGKLGEFELDAAWARYYAARHDDAQAEKHWLLAYQKAAAAQIERLQPEYLKELVNFYTRRGQPAQAQRYANAYIRFNDDFTAAQSVFHVAQYEGERVEQAQNAQIGALRQQQAVQAVRLRLGQWLLLGAGLAVVLVSGLVVFIYRQLRTNRRTLAQLRDTQAQLVQAEKMAFLGELTSGIAHELQNPLTFMKSFAEVSTELVDDIDGQAAPHQNGSQLRGEILAGLKQNLQQISQHGQRASSIIKDMLEHSRSGTGQRVPTDLNALAEENLLLAYQALRTQSPDFSAQLIRDLDPHLGPVAVVASDLGRVLLNLCANALHAVRERQRELALVPVSEVLAAPHYEPTVTVRTRRLSGRTVEIRVCDNGTGMPDHVREKIFQPFFTTKPVGEGTGLGLSLCHDIIAKGHGGTLAVDTCEGKGTEFIITLSPA